MRFQELRRQVGKQTMIASTSIDFLIRIKNGARAGRKTIDAPASKFCISIAELMKKIGYIADYTVSEGVKKVMTITLAYNGRVSKISDIQLFSKPGRRLYTTSLTMPWGKTKESLIIISTSAGVMSQKEAKSKKLGGEVIAEIY